MTLPKPAFTQAGDVTFMPDGAKLVVSGAISDNQNEHYETDTIDVASGWDSKGAPLGLGILATDGKVTTITISGRLAGVVTL